MFQFHRRVVRKTVPIFVVRDETISVVDSSMTANILGGRSCCAYYNCCCCCCCCSQQNVGINATWRMVLSDPHQKEAPRPMLVPTTTRLSARALYGCDVSLRFPGWLLTFVHVSNVSLFFAIPKLHSTLPSNCCYNDPKQKPARQSENRRVGM